MDNGANAPSVKERSDFRGSVTGCQSCKQNLLVSYLNILRLPVPPGSNF